VTEPGPGGGGAGAFGRGGGGMWPPGPLGRRQVKKLKGYAGPGNPKSAQNPVTPNLAAATAR